MTTQTEALKLALKDLKWIDNWICEKPMSECVKKLRKSISAIKEALAQPEQEPVALRHSFDGYGYLYTDMGFGSGWIEWTKRSKKDAEPLYTTPPQRTWVGLTDEEIDVAIKAAKKVDTGYAGWVRDQRKEYAKAIEAKLKEKNT